LLHHQNTTLFGFGLSVGATCTQQQKPAFNEFICLNLLNNFGKQLFAGITDFPPLNSTLFSLTALGTLNI